MSRFVIEGEWTGYRSSQRRIVHCTVHQSGEKTLANWAAKYDRLLFTDGTALLIHIRGCKPRERVKQIQGYTSLIKDCAYYGVNSVSDLDDAKSAAVVARLAPAIAKARAAL